MIRILQIVDNMDLGGIQAFIMNTYRALVNDNIQFDFLVFQKRKQLYEEEIFSLGGKIYKLSSRREGILKCKKELKDFFALHTEYNVVHYQTSSLSFIEPLIFSHKFGVKTRIIHAHSTKAPGSKIHTILHYINKIRISRIANVYFSCGKLASKWMFSKTKCESKVRIINNGIEVKKYSYNINTRNRLRRELRIEDNYVIGHVGRFSSVKNHVFLIKVFSQLVKRNVIPNLKLLLVGTGEETDKIRNMVTNFGLIDKVLFLGQRNDVESVLQAMDSFVMPSFYEGFPVAAIEAQAAGLPCFLSDSITSDSKLKDNVHMISLNKPVEFWCEMIEKEKRRIADNLVLYENGFDIAQTIDKLKKTYNN